jgi:beta-fructofuranosidase
MRTTLHFTPARGWLNDPNGLIEHHGVHHLFFQHNPHDVAMRDMCWGHATSTDLLTWTEHPVALAPGPDGSYDGDGCWSGCAVHDGNGVAVVYSGHHDGIELPCLARPVDDELIRWEKSPANPVIDRRPPIEGITDMRDHSVRWDGATWRQVLAGGVGGEGVLYGYSSPDLIHWSWDGIVLGAHDLDLPGPVWECPDVFVDGDHLVAIISVGAGKKQPVIWVIGGLEAGRIIPLRWGLVDYGDLFYAPQSYCDHTGRRIMFGWLQTQLDAAALGQANLGATSLPRILSVVDGRLHQEPAVEIRHRRGRADRLTIAAGEATLTVPVDLTTALEVELRCESSDDLLDVKAIFQDQAGHDMTVALAIFASGGPPADGEGPHPVAREAKRATLLFDAGIVEVFLDDGRAAAQSDARLVDVHEIRFTRHREAPIDVTVWSLP